MNTTENKSSRNDGGVFDELTNKYSLSKTLRFELRPVGKTLENMRSHLNYDEKLQTFLKDQAIEDAYQLLKPIVDGYHEEFITDSLQSEKAKQINFSHYVELRKTLVKVNNDLKDAKAAKKVTKELEKQVEKIQKEMSETENMFRTEIGEAFEWAGDNWKKEKYPLPRYEWKKGSKIASGPAVLYSQDILALIGDVHQDNEKVQKALKVFKGFFTYFSGFNQNRENYYTTKTEKATAVATRIVHENLPMFSDNVLLFATRETEYLHMFDFLRSRGKALENKDGTPLTPISQEVFHSTHFNMCLTQGEIEKYNELIGNANYLVNQYNQERGKEEKFKRLSTFNTLYKQIGCGKKKPLFFALTHDNKLDADEVRIQGNEAFSVEEVLLLAKEAGEKYFRGRSGNDQIDTVLEFTDYVKAKESYEGVYWSKVALNSISSRYFADWRTLAMRLRDAKVLKKAAKGEEEDIKIPDAIELQGLFEVLDASENWQQEGVFFRNSITEEIEGGKNKEKNGLRRSIIANARRPSEALLGLIVLDIEEHSKNFLNIAERVTSLTSYKGVDEKMLIKEWMDSALSVTQILKYFRVRESKAKGAPIDPLISSALKTLLYSEDVDWFKWYDALRNYLTKKPQDDVKENKLKLNFENGSLLGGWSDGQETSKASVLLKNDNTYYLGILKRKNLFETDEDKNRQVYSDTSSNCGRLILANLKFQTLAGRGFVGEFNKKYSEFGLENPQEAIRNLQKIIRDRYAKKYPLLKRIAETSYLDKKTFDKDIQETLKECYVCEFTPINWGEVESCVDRGEMYLFQISSKDSNKDTDGKKDLQTLYWSAVFEDGSPFQLNGGGEVFYRKYAIKEKKVKMGYEHKPWIVEKKRFTENKQLTKNEGANDCDGKIFFFHCPIKLNYKAKSYAKPAYAFSEISKMVNDEFSGMSDTCFLGIDRGEKHLAFYSLINQNGKILDQGTLNMPFVDEDGKPRVIKVMRKMGDGSDKEVECWNYNDLLEARAGDRDYARKNWQTIGTIKNLKEGYISQVVRAVADLATQDNKPTYIVLEDLNTNFKRMRQKVEKSVYQKFEVALAKKLNFLVNKSAKMDEIGSVTRALQLTPPVNNYGDIERKKQAGIMLYTRPNYTSQTDPATGWRKSIYLKKGSEDFIKDQIVGNDKRKIVAAFSEIRFDGKDYYFAYQDTLGKSWKLFSGKDGISLDRFHKERNEGGEWIAVSQNVARILDELFANFDKSESLLEQMKSGVALKKPQDVKYTAWESLRFTIDLIQQIRNTGTIEKDNDFLLSPVRDENGNHFDTRVYLDKEMGGEKAEMPTCGDAVGAFNIARKGLIMNEHIKRGLSLFIKDEEWDAWLAGKDKWETWLVKNENDLLLRKKS